MFPTISPPNGADDESRCRAGVRPGNLRQAAIQFDDQVDVVFQLEPVVNNPLKHLQHNNIYSPTYSSANAFTRYCLLFL